MKTCSGAVLTQAAKKGHDIYLHWAKAAEAETRLGVRRRASAFDVPLERL